MIAFILAWLAVFFAWVYVTSVPANKSRSAGDFSIPPKVSYAILRGDGFVASENTAVLTDVFLNRDEQMGFVQWKPVDLRGVGLSFDFMFEEDILRKQNHHYALWLSLGGDPSKEDPKTSVIEAPGSVFKVSVSDYASNSLSISSVQARATGPIPKSVWHVLSLKPKEDGKVTVMLNDREIEEAILPDEPLVLFISGKTSFNNGIRLRNVRLGNRSEIISFVQGK